MKMTPEDPRTGTDLLDPLDGINRSRRWFRPGQTVLVAFSAGLDSTALLDLLVRLAARVRFRVEAATVDHGLRPFSQEISTAAGLCARLSATHHVLALEPGLAERSRSACTSLQEQARTERYALLASTALRIGADRIATAHHADDQAETLLLRLSAGTGLDGLSGILEQRDDRVVRPLLSFRREDLERYVALRGLPFVEDPTNRSHRFVRNRIRSSVIPALVEAVPSAVLGIARSAALLSNERAVVDSLLDEKLEKASRTALEMGQEGLSVAGLGQGPLRTALLHRWLARSGVRHSAAHLAALEKLLERRDGGSAGADLPLGRSACLEYGVLRLQAGRTQPSRPPPSGPSAPVPTTPLPVPGRVRLASGTIVASRVGSWEPGEERRDACRTAFAEPGPALPLAVRAPVRGDRTVPRSGRGSRLLSDLISEARIPRRLRPLVPVVIDASGGILWVAGLRASALYPPVTGQPALVLELVGD